MAPIKTAISLYDGMTGPLRSITKVLDTVITHLEGVGGGIDRAMDPAKLMDCRSELIKVNGQFETIENSISNAQNKQEKFNNSIQDASSPADALLRKVMQIGAAVGGIRGAQKVLDLSDTMVTNQARLSMIVDDGGSVAELEAKIRASAARSRAAYMTTADAISKIGLMAGNAFSSNDELIGFTEQLNKQFVIAGTSAVGVSAAMTQITQAMGSGVLRGEELNSVFEQAPTIIQTIADYMDVPIGSIREMASEGQITAEVFKNAMLWAAEETNARFEEMPMTFSQMMNTVKNDLLYAFQPVLTRINELINSEKFQAFLASATASFEVLGQIAMRAMDAIAAGASFVYDNWSFVAPIIFGVVAAMTAYTIAAIINKAITAIAAIKETLHAAALARKTHATFAATVAQSGLNTALLACPLTWIVISIIALVAIIYIVVAAINKWKGTTISATGVIAGSFSVLLAFLDNNFIVPFQNAFASVANFLGNLFNNPAAAVKVLIADLVLFVLDKIKSMLSAIETVVNKLGDVLGFSVDFTSNIDSLYQDIEDWRSKVKEESDWREYVKPWEKRDYGEAYQSGYDWGKGMADKVKGMFQVKENENESGFGDPYAGLLQNTGDTAENTAQIADDMEITEENLRYLREIAERDAINRYTTAEIHIEQHNENHIASDTDLDAMTEYFCRDFGEKLVVSGEGGHL